MRQPAPPHESQMAARTRTAAASWSIVAFGALFLLGQIGYEFERGDQLQYLLLPYREIYEHFLPGDWFTWQTSHYHVTYSWLVRGVHALSGEVYFPMAMFFAHCATLVALVYSIVRLSLALGFGRTAALAAVLIFGFLRETGPAGTTLNHGSLVPSDMAMPPLLLACAAWLSRRPLATGVWLGLAGLCHANFAVLAPLLLGPLELERAIRTRSFRGFIHMVVAFVVIAAPTLFMIARSFLTRDPDPGAVAITLFLRAGHHYDLGAMPIAEFAWPIALALAAAPAFLTRDAHWADRCRLVAACGAVLVIAFIGSGFHVVALARLFAFRMFTPLLVLLALGTGYVVQQALQQRQLRLALWAVASVALLLAVGPDHKVSEDGDNGSEGPHTEHAIRTFDATFEIFPPVRSLMARVRTKTPTNARFLIPPGMLSFRMLARRSVFVDWKCAPMKGDEAREWHRRMLSAMDVDRFPSRGFELQKEADVRYLQRPLVDLVAVARLEGLTHVVASNTSRLERHDGVRFLFSNSGYAVFEVSPRAH